MSKQSLPAVQMPHMLDFISHSTVQTARLGQRLAEHLHPGDLLLLQGALGVGKTQLVRGIAQGLGSNDLVTSPSFVLVNEYQARVAGADVRIYHIDLYRIEDPAELQNIGIDEIWSGQDICLIEWAEHAADRLPTEHLLVQMSHLDETKRVLRFVPIGERYRQLLEAFKQTTFG